MSVILQPVQRSIYEFWFQKGVAHRPVEDGPALIWYDRHGNIVRQQWWVWGVQQPPPEGQSETPMGDPDIPAEPS